jgi:hypothetical protein
MLSNDKLNRLNIAHGLFLELLERKAGYPKTVREELESDLRECGEKIEELQYAKVWTQETPPEGTFISEEEFDDLVKNKSGYKIFIIDKGEYKLGSVGEAYFDNNPVFPQPEKDKKIDSNKAEDEKIFLTPLEYRLLVYTLKQKGVPGDLFNLVEYCWFESKEAKDLKILRQQEVRGEYIEGQSFDDRTKKYVKAISLLTKLLKKYFGIRLITKGTRKYKLDPITPHYYVIEKLKSKF